MNKASSTPSPVNLVSRRQFLATATLTVAGIAIAGCASAATPAAYPTKNVELIAPSNPGGGTDIFCRAVEAALKEDKLLSVGITTVNKPGGSNTVGTQYTMQQKPDGYTLVYADAILYTSVLMGEVDWNWRKDLTYLAKMAEDVNLICVLQDSPYKSFKEIIDAAKAKPDQVKLGGSITGSSDHIGNVLLNKRANVKTTYIPYKNSAEAITALLGGHIDACWANPNEIIGQIEAKKARAVAVADKQRIQGFPLFADVPTVKEQIGVDIVATQWRGLAGPPGLPKDVVDFWVQTLDKMRKADGFKKKYLQDRMLVDGFLTGDALLKYMEAEEAELRTVFTEAGLLKEKK